MLSAEAYSFKLKARLAISLSWVAGYTNVITLAVTGHVVSHTTGNSTMLGNSLGELQFAEFRFFGFLILMFFVGAVSSAIMTESARRHGLRSKYVLPIAVETILLILFTIGINENVRAAPGTLRSQFLLCGIATFAMGIQNATITKISGATVRTTHLTGVITDVGLEGIQLFFWYWDQFRSRKRSRFARALRATRRQSNFLRLLLLANIFGSFVFGATIGTVVFFHQPNLSMALPVAFLLWIIFQDFRRPIPDIKELDPVGDPDLHLDGIIKSLLPADIGIYRLAFRPNAPHRAPNFSFWAERVTRNRRVLILTFSPRIEFDQNAALNLQTAVKQLQQRGRHLILAGITAPQFKSLSRHNVTSTLDPANLCTDLEFAIARALNILHELNPNAWPKTERSIA